jgi:hypothetical protein
VALREKINNHTALVAVVAVVATAGAIAFLVFRGRSGTTPNPEIYFYDLTAKQPNPLDRLFTARMSEIPPISPPSGGTLPDGSPAGVRAMVFACGSCDDASARYIGYLITTPAKARGQPAAPGLPTAPMGPTGQLIRSLQSEAWVPLTSGEGFAIMEASRTRCGGDQTPVDCLPGASR